MHAFRTLALAVLSLGLAAEARPQSSAYKHVAVFSIDGLHASDVEKYLAARPKSTIASLLETGYEYTQAYTSAPSDSFPGAQAQFTGASPRTHGVWYDDTWDRTYFAPGSDCTGKPGAEVVYTEALDYDDTALFSGGINPANLPKALVNGVCTAVWPHQRLRVNTVFEVVNSKGLATAYTDKHPAYDMVRGPSGKGLSLGYFPEINAVAVAVNETIGYDQYHVDAFLNWIDGKDPQHSEGSLNGKTPTLFGGNFQSVSVAQKTVGYQNATGNPFTPQLLKALDFVDNSLGQIVNKLKSKGIYEDTLIVVASKHGQAAIDPAKYRKIAPSLVTKAAGVPIAFQTSDDIANLFLENHADVLKAVAGLKAQAKALAIVDIIYGERLIEMGFGNSLVDPAVPDIIVRPEVGIIYTNSNSKIAEHGGISDDDRHVGVFVSNPKLKQRKISTKTETKQIGPTILKALGLNPLELKGAVIEKTELLEGFEVLEGFENFVEGFKGFKGF